MQNFKPRITEKRWDIRREEELLKIWDEEQLYKFRFDPSDKREIIAIDTPPPYPSGRWHVGGTAHYAQIDMIARYLRMKGYNVLVPFYADRNGLPVEVQVEKMYKIDAHEVPREKFLELCRQFLDKMEKEIVEIWRRVGCGFDYWKNGTDSEEYRKLTQATFIELWKRGLIYEAERPVNWCPRCKTTLADAELEYKEEATKLYYIKFEVVETGEDIVIATTRPELLPACRLVIYNPEDSRYKHLEGKHAKVPLFGQVVPIRAHPYARPEFGTGILMVCSYGDQNDVRILRELGIKPVIVVTRDGKLNENAGKYAGLRVREARKYIVEDLKREGLLVKEEEYVHEIPVCWRCKTPVEIIHEREYFLKQLEFKEELKKVVQQMKFYPEEHRRKLLDWIDAVAADWPISRSRFYGTEIPLWRCKRCGAALVPEPGRYYRPWKEEPPFEKCPKCGAPKEELVGETKVFDTWFDSSISVLYVTGYMRDPELFKRAFGNTLRPQGVDIIRTWLYYSILRVYQLLGKPAFKWVRITGMGLDEKGEAMHKSKGNVIDPAPFIEKYGADAFRFWAAAAAKLGSDYRWNEQLVKTGSSFATKVWNIARFISSFPEPEEDECKLMPLDLMILGVLNDVIAKVDAAYSNFDVYEPANELFHFIWRTFADHYIEAVKPRAYNREGEFSEEEQKGAWFTLYTVLKASLKMLAPIMPFVTDYIWRKLYGKSIHTERFPEPNPKWDTEYKKLIDKFKEFNSKIWTYKKSRKIALNQPLNAIVYAPKELEPLARDLKAMHRIAELRFGEPSDEEKAKGEHLGSGIYIIPL